jgi:hypothetical protein
MGAPPVGHARLATGPTRHRDSRGARKGGGLTVDGAPRGVEFVAQLVVFAAQSLALGFRPAQILAQPIDLATLFVDDLRGVSPWRVVALLRHATVMPDSVAQYKREMRVSTADPLT